MRKNRVCPVKHAGSFDIFWRKWFQDPYRILTPFIREGMTVIDYGCGPGFFTIPMANLVGESGTVLAVDIQEGMLEILKAKIKDSKFKKCISPHKCGEEEIGISDSVDFILAFYVVHEISRQNLFFRELHSILKPKCLVYIVEPPFHVSKSAFLKSLEIAQLNGFVLENSPGILFNRTALLRKV